MDDTVEYIVVKLETYERLENQNDALKGELQTLKSKENAVNKKSQDDAQEAESRNNTYDIQQEAGVENSNRVEEQHMQNSNSDMFFYSVENILSKIKDKWKQNSKYIIDKIIKQKKILRWDNETGEIIINNNVISGSNIIDLLNFLQTTDVGKKQQKPLGTIQFFSALKFFKIAKKRIKNPLAILVITGKTLPNINSNKKWIKYQQ